MNLHLERRRTLLHSRTEGIKERAEKLFTDAGVVTRKEALAKMRPALALKGDPLKGQAVFTELCAKCHTIGSEGSDLAPNLTEIFRKSSETLLHDIVDPNAGANAEYIAYNIETKGGDFYAGIVIRDDATGVTLRDAEGEHEISRDDIAEFFSNGLSLMPEELEAGMKTQTMADLLAYLQEPK
jgi:putative heme-binding domain-containing protein